MLVRVPAGPPGTCVAPIGLQADSGAVVIGQDGTANFTNCVFEGNSGSAGGAILADVGTTLTVDKCTFTGNKVPSP